VCVGCAPPQTHREASDFDVLAVFALPIDALLSTAPARKSLKVCVPASGGQAEITIGAHEARHACTLLAGGNPTMYEALRSPIVYRDRHGWLTHARALLAEHLEASELRIARVRRLEPTRHAVTSMCGLRHVSTSMRCCGTTVARQHVSTSTDCTSMGCCADACSHSPLGC
jgi:hypothetical protein